MIANILIYEDDKYSNFLPLAYLRPVYDQISGMSTLLAKIVRNFPEANISLHCRGYLKNIVRQNHPGISVNNVNTGIGCLVVNGRLLVKDDLSKDLEFDGDDRMYLNDDDEVIAAYLNTDNLYILKDMLEEVFTSRHLLSVFRNKTEVNKTGLTLLEYPWELINDSAYQIDFDYKKLVSGGLLKGEISSATNIIEEHKIFIGENSRLYPNVTLNAEQGPIYIGENTEIKPGSYIEGPVYIGNTCSLLNATILPGTSVGPGSVVNNSEIKNTILHGYSKIENSFICSSYIGDAVDFRGVLIKDEVSPFKDTGDIYIDGYELRTSETLLGMFCADYCRLTANLVVNSGTVLGVGSYCEVGSDILPRYIPSFVNQKSSSKFEELSIAKSLEMIHYYFNRKELELSKVEEDLIEYVYAKFAHERKLDRLII